MFNLQCFFHGFYVFSLGYLNIKFVLEIHHCYHKFYVRHVGRYHLSCEGAISPSRMCKEGKVGKGVYAQFVLSVLLKYFIFKCFEYRNIVFVCFSALYLNFLLLFLLRIQIQ